MTNNSTQKGANLRNMVIAVVAIVLSIGIFFGWQTKTVGVSIDSQAKQSIPLELALSNGKPTVTEFYANWCTSCQAMAKDLAELKQKYASTVNFVMLNVDNNKWLPEVLRYRVDGIPHFVFLNSQGETIAQSIGEQPQTILDANISALIAELPLPYAKTSGQVSQFNRVMTTQKSSDDPRSHGSI